MAAYFSGTVSRKARVYFGLTACGTTTAVTSAFVPLMRRFGGASCVDLRSSRRELFKRTTLSPSYQARTKGVTYGR
jgi:hypothetical protein